MQWPTRALRSKNRARRTDHSQHCSPMSLFASRQPKDTALRNEPKTPERTEHERIRASFLTTLISCSTCFVAILIFIGAATFWTQPGRTLSPLRLIDEWLASAGRLSNFLLERVDPVSTSISTATLATALVLACAFSRKPDSLLMPTEVIRLQFLETVTSATSLIAGSALVVCSALLTFGGTDTTVGAGVSFGCGLLTLSLGTLVPVSPRYWERAIENERRALTRLERGRPHSAQAMVSITTWLQLMFINALLRTAWLVSSFHLIAAQHGQHLHWTPVIGIAIPLALGTGLAWDLSITWARLYLSTTLLTDRWIAIPIYLIWACAISLLSISVIRIAMQTTWLIGLFLGGCLSVPFITNIAPILGQYWKMLHAARFDSAIRDARTRISRFESLQRLTQGEQDTPATRTVNQDAHVLKRCGESFDAEGIPEAAECKRRKRSLTRRRVYSWLMRRRSR